MSNTFNNKKVPNVPNLRFPEFTDEWQIFKCSDVLDFYSTNSLAWDQLNFCNGAIRNIHYGLIHKGLATHVYIDKAFLPYINDDVEIKKYFQCKNGDIIFADASEDTLDVGKAVEIIDCDKTQLVCGLHTLHGRDTKSCTEVGYKGYVFASTSFRHQVRRIAQGTKVFSISSRNFKELFIGIPSKPEQTKIATLLSLIDQRIETQNKIINKLESLIKGIGTSYLKKNVLNATLKECLNCHSSNLAENKVIYKDDGYPIYGATGQLGTSDNLLMKNDAILIIKDGASVGKVQLTDGGFSYLGTLNALTPKKNTSLCYLYYTLKLFDFKKYIVGSGIPHIYFKDYANEKVFLPSYEKQLFLGNLLYAIETRRDLEIKQLESIANLKKFLLNNLFI